MKVGVEFWNHHGVGKEVLTFGDDYEMCQFTIQVKNDLIN